MPDPISEHPDDRLSLDHTLAAAAGITAVLREATAAAGGMRDLLDAVLWSWTWEEGESGTPFAGGGPAAANKRAPWEERRHPENPAAPAGRVPPGRETKKRNGSASPAGGGEGENKPGIVKRLIAAIGETLAPGAPRSRRPAVLSASEAGEGERGSANFKGGGKQTDSAAGAAAYRQIGSPVDKTDHAAGAAGNERTGSRATAAAGSPESTAGLFARALSEAASPAYAQCRDIWRSLSFALGYENPSAETAGQAVPGDTSFGNGIVPHALAPPPAAAIAGSNPAFPAANATNVTISSMPVTVRGGSGDAIASAIANNLLAKTQHAYMGDGSVGR